MLRNLEPATKYEITDFDPVTGKSSANQIQSSSDAGAMRVDASTGDHDRVLLIKQLSLDK